MPVILSHLLVFAKEGSLGAACRAHSTCRLLERDERDVHWHGLFQCQSASRSVLITERYTCCLTGSQVTANLLIPCMQVHEGTHAEVEAFVHGALCVSYRRAATHHQCLLSSDHPIPHALWNMIVGCLPLKTDHVVPVPQPRRQHIHRRYCVTCHMTTTEKVH